MDASCKAWFSLDSMSVIPLSNLSMPGDSWYIKMDPLPYPWSDVCDFRGLTPQLNFSGHRTQLVRVC